MLNIIWNQYFNEIILGLFGITLLTSIISIVQLYRLNKKYKRIIKEFGTKDVEQLFVDNLENLKKVEEENKSNKEEIKKIQEILKSCMQKYGVVRYTAFEDVGSDLSFAIAFLDGKDDGIVLNGIFSREGSTVFAKPIHNGESKHNLSEEEQKAIERAKRRSVE